MSTPAQTTFQNVSVAVPPQPGLSCPPQYLNRSDTDLREAILAIKAKMGDSLTILGHHYQNDAIVELSDFKGDSFKLCRDAANATAKYIIFCGVRFMAESARILARPDQIVIHPEEKAGCPMADMANIEQAEEAWRILSAMNPGRRIVPICYMNSNADIKAFCGRHGGSVCTSSNAENVLKWAWDTGDLILFLPDEHLGRNTASKMGVDPSKVLVWNPQHAEAHSRDARYSEAKLVVWKGFCYVHVRFKPEHIHEMLAKYPDATVIVHPECPIEVAGIAHASASTEGIINYVKAAKPGSTIIVGTEINLVMRLAKQFPDRQIIPLHPSLCLNMAKITLGHLLWVLENPGSIGTVSVDPALVADSQAALKKMLEIG